LVEKWEEKFENTAGKEKKVFFTNQRRERKTKIES
jgi:hypothetical protein